MSAPALAMQAVETRWKDDAANESLAGLLALAAGGCATSAEIEDKARTHAFRSEQAAARGDYALAGREKEEAARLHAKAVERAYKHGETAMVEVPANVPAPPTRY